ncbi:MAG TPA: HDOD domain-containing protein [Oxalicibacterium sp.]|jgi:HD-like signal output (HDOD) protein|nr:HDOD domain-containing protein [Oxalicibacterium sp.]
MPDRPSTSRQQTSSGELARPVNIPPRPSLLMALQREMAKADPHITRVGTLLKRDAAIAGNMIAVANSALFNLPRRVHTVEDAILMIGLEQCRALVTSMMTRRALARGRMMMPRFWDVSEKRSWAMLHLAAKTKLARPEVAHHFGLFSDIGIPLMMASFPSYGETLAVANRMPVDKLIQLENARHKINHALVGAMLAEHWQIGEDIAQAIKKHHTPQILRDEQTSSRVRNLIAIHLIVDRAIQEYRRDLSNEWAAGGALVCEMLGLSESDVTDFCAELQQRMQHPYNEQTSA